MPALHVSAQYWPKAQDSISAPNDAIVDVTVPTGLGVGTSLISNRGIETAMRSWRPNAHVGQGATLVRVLCPALLGSGLALLPAPAASQGTATEYARSEGLRARIDGVVVDAAEAPLWIGPPSNQFVY